MIVRVYDDEKSQPRVFSTTLLFVATMSAHRKTIVPSG